MVRSDINAWTYSSFSYKENWSQVTLAINCQIQFVLDGPTAIKPVVLASLDNSLTQCGSVCPVRGGNQKVWDRKKKKNLLYLLPLRKFLNKTYLLAPISS